MNHTKGKLIADKNGLILGGEPFQLKRGTVVRQLAMVCCLEGGSEEQDANTKRLVDCWNGCEDVKNPAAIGQLIDAVNRLWAAKEALEITNNPQDANILRELYNAWLDLRDARNAVEGH